MSQGNAGAAPAAPQPTSRSLAVLTLTVLVPFGLGYFMSYLFRTVNAIISPQLVRDVGLTPADLGLMTSAYFVTFAAFQLPLGIILDRYGPRKVQATLMMVAALGAALFAVGTDETTLVIARAVVGLGVSGCLMAARKANVLWFPPEKIALVNGLTFAFGTAGALSTTVPLEILVQSVPWRTVFWWLAGVSVLAGILIYTLVPVRARAIREAAAAGAPRITDQVAELKNIYGSRFFWRVATIVLLHNGLFLAYQSLWAAPWLRDVAGLDRAGVADAMFMFNAGMLVGVLTIGVFAERIQRLGVPTIVPAGVGMGLSILVQCLFALEWTAYPALLCALFGYFGSSAVLSYTVFSQHFPERLSARVHTANNMMTFIAAFFMQWAVGAIIGLYPSPGEGLYSAEGHQLALIVFIAIEFCGYVFFLWPQRKREDA